MSTSQTTKLVRPLRGGQMTIPAEFRRQLGITEQTMLRVTLDDGGLRVVPVEVEVKTTGSPWLRELYELFAPVRADILARGISEEEVNADIEVALAEVRAQNRHDCQ